MLQRLKERGLRICVWLNPYIAQRSPLFAEGKQNGYLLKKPNGDVWQTDQWQAGMGIVDFTNPAARQWYGDKLRALLDMGVDCFKTDFGERIPIEVVYHDGSDPLKMHNYYTYLYNQTIFEVLRERRGEGEAVLFARSATAGSQQFPVHWGGDCESTFEAMAESLRGGLSLGLAGFGFWSHDIGGFEGTPPGDVYKRWIAFGLLSSHSRLHGSNSYRVPWLFDEEAVDVLRHFTQLKCRLMPYLLCAALEAHHTGVPADARHAAGIPRRSGLRLSRSAIHARRVAAGRAGLLARGKRRLLSAVRSLDPFLDGQSDRRSGLAAGDARLLESALAGATQFRHCYR